MTRYRAKRDDVEGGEVGEIEIEIERECEGGGILEEDIR
jgi:hypothetical protein